MMHQFDEGKAEGRVEGKAEGIEEGKAQEREKFLAIIYDIKAGISVEEIAQKYQVEVELIERLK
jgi:predicted transposase YdaD